MTTNFLDTETIASRRIDVQQHIAAKHLDPDELVKAAKKAATELEKTSLSGLFGELAVLSFARDDDEPITGVRNMADPMGERELLRWFADQPGIDAARIVAHNAEFDRLMIRHRAIVHGVKLPKVYMASDVKPWESRWRCTMALWCDSRAGRVSLDDLCLALGLPGKQGIDGSMVNAMVAAGRIDEVAAYCADDVRRVRAVYQRIMGVAG